jgi:hypothetical protein
MRNHEAITRLRLREKRKATAEKDEERKQRKIRKEERLKKSFQGVCQKMEERAERRDWKAMEHTSESIDCESISSICMADIDQRYL